MRLFTNKFIFGMKDFYAERLQEALKFFEGKHNFNYFHKTGTVTHTTLREKYKGYHIIYFQANGFLRSKGRMMIDATMQ